MGVSLLLASAFAGTLSRSIVHPLDTLRSRLMVSTSATSSLRQALSDLLCADGVRGLYRGFAVSVTMQAPAVATYLSTYEHAKRRLSAAARVPAAAPPVHLAAGLVAEAVSAVFWVPMEVIKQRAQVRAGAVAAATPALIARDLLAREGPRALFRGYGLTVAVFGPYSMIYFVAYERFKRVAAARVAAPAPHPAHHLPASAVAASAAAAAAPAPAQHLPASAVAASAAAAGAIAAACTTPLDVVKTRLQTQGDVARPARPAYSGTWAACKTIAREEGARAFFRGLSARVLWIMPGTAITMSTFEFLKSYFRLAPADT